jgi:hypothetical protein
MTLAMCASARLTIEPGIQLTTLRGRTLTVATSTTTRSGPGLGSAAAHVAARLAPRARQAAVRVNMGWRSI